MNRRACGVVHDETAKDIARGPHALSRLTLCRQAGVHRGECFARHDGREIILHNVHLVFVAVANGQRVAVEIGVPIEFAVTIK